MTQMRIRSDWVVFAAVFLLGLTSVGLILGKNPQMKAVFTAPPKVAAEGSRLEPLTGYRWDSHDATLVVALREGCRYCEASMSLYSRLAALRRLGQLNVYPLILYPDGKASSHTEIGEIPRLTNVDYAKVGIRGTPTVLLIDSHGVVRHKWAGQLPAAQEDDLLQAARTYEPSLPAAVK